MRSLTIDYNSGNSNTFDGNIGNDRMDSIRVSTYVWWLGIYN